MSGTQQTEALRIAEILERSPTMTTNKPEVLAWRWRKPIVNGQGETVGASAWEYAATPGFYRGGRMIPLSASATTKPCKPSARS